MSLLDTHIGFLEALRSAGLSVSLAEGLDAIDAMRHIGWGDREVVRTAYAATLVKRQPQRVTFDAIFDLYFPRLVGDGVAGRARPSADGGARDNGAAAEHAFTDELAEALAGAGRGPARCRTSRSRPWAVRRDAGPGPGAVQLVGVHGACNACRPEQLIGQRSSPG